MQEDKDYLNKYKATIGNASDKVITDFRIEQMVCQKIETLMNTVKEDTETFTLKEKEDIMQIYMEYEIGIKQMFKLGFSEKEKEIEDRYQIERQKQENNGTQTVVLTILRKRINEGLIQLEKENPENPIWNMLIVDRGKFLNEAIANRWFEKADTHTILGLTDKWIEEQKTQMQRERQVS